MHLHLLLAVICPILTRSVSCRTSKARRGDPTCARLQYDAPDQGWVEAGRGSSCRKEVVLHSLKNFLMAEFLHTEHVEKRAESRFDGYMR